MNKESEHVELNKKKWDARSATYDEKRFDYFRFFQKRVISLLNLQNGQRFLDIGCGTGWAVRYAAGLVGESGEACGIDISAGMIAKAIVNSNDIKNVRFLEANAEELPFNENFFDANICTNSFHHYLNPSKVLTEIFRVLKPGGRIYIMDPSTDGYIMKMIDRWVMGRERDHVKLYSTKEYREFFTGANLKYIGSKIITPPMKVHIAEKGRGGLFNIEQATEKELKQIQALDHMTLGSDSRKAFLDEAVSAGRCLVAINGDRVAGFGILDQSLYGQNFIALLIVHPDHRRKGIATALIHRMESICPTRKLFTSTNESNIPAQKTYESLGFVRSGYIENLDEGDPEIIYFKRLADTGQGGSV